MMLNPIEVVCVYAIQPIIDYLGYLKNEVHFVVFLVATALIGIVLGLFLGILTIIWYKLTRSADEAKKAALSAEKEHSDRVEDVIEDLMKEKKD
ncbi:uncharacterized protein LOC115626351 [Scaptodrosophila lebanonensis]|uniref:Uncharacterized protein LOC115626351 n=1 Tax=Drosophila lebanonensis TaxID=7225 RepID=A0A6J2TPX4_DROLE|nr:uncharacterized protein LOC115626351 [Scaptodrosophila lebanonensis]